MEETEESKGLALVGKKWQDLTRDEKMLFARLEDRRQLVLEHGVVKFPLSKPE